MKPSDGERAAQRWTWSVGDRVQRRRDVFDDKSEMRHGVVIRRYSRECRFGLGRYDELYDVRWDDWREEHAFLPHGLDAEPATGLTRLLSCGTLPDAMGDRRYDLRAATSEDILRAAGGLRRMLGGGRLDATHPGLGVRRLL